MSICTVVIIACHSSRIILSQNMIKDQLKNFTYSLYHIRTMPHESIRIIGRIANPPGMELCAEQLPQKVVKKYSKIKPGLFLDKISNLFLVNEA